MKITSNFTCEITKKMTKKYLSIKPTMPNISLALIPREIYFIIYLSTGFYLKNF